MDWLTKEISRISWNAFYNDAKTPEEATIKAMTRQQMFGSAQPLALEDYLTGVELQIYSGGLNRVHEDIASNCVAFLKTERLYAGVQ